MNDNYLSLKQVAEKFGVSRLTIRRHIAQGKLKAFRVGALKIAVTTEALKEYMDKYSVRANEKGFPNKK